MIVSPKGLYRDSAHSTTHRTFDTRFDWINLGRLEVYAGLSGFFGKLVNSVYYSSENFSIEIFVSTSNCILSSFFAIVFKG